MLEIFVGVFAALSLRDIILTLLEYYKNHQRNKRLQLLLDELEDYEADDDCDEDCECKD